jgi:hypothetical protein
MTTEAVVNVEKLPSYVAYLPLRDGHAIPVVDLSPESLKASVKTAHRNPTAKLRHTTALGAVVHALGFKGAFPGYLKAYPDLQAFMARNDLRVRRDLIRCTDGFAPIHLHRQQVAERLFASEYPLPRRLFTGWDFDWAAWEGPHQKYQHAFDAEFGSYPYKHGDSASGSGDVHMVANLLGDALVDPGDPKNLVVQLYFTNDYPAERSRAEVQGIRRMYQAFRERFLNPATNGWVEVLPYNKHLVFLRGNGGAYDFVFRNARDTRPPAPPYSGCLTPHETPVAYLLQKSFETFEYARPGVWREREWHDAEVTFYARGGTIQTYPGVTEILKRYLHGNEKGHGHEQLGPQQAEGFTPVRLTDGRLLLVSDPIRIDEFRRFLDETGWLRHRRRFQEDENPLEPANLDPEHLPVTVTYYDALAYTAWVERKRKLPVRLPTIAEYRELHPARKKQPDDEDGLDPRSNRFRHGHVHWLVPTAKGMVTLPPEHSRPYLPSAQWQQVEARFAPGLPKAIVRGIQFYLSPSFGEWLHENHAQTKNGSAAAVSTYDLSPIHGLPGSPLERDFMPARSWGKYRHCKIGFRLCFVGE